MNDNQRKILLEYLGDSVFYDAIVALINAKIREQYNEIGSSVTNPIDKTFKLLSVDSKVSALNDFMCTITEINRESNK